MDLLDILITEIFSDAARASDKARLRTIKDLDAAAIQLTQVCRLVLDPDNYRMLNCDPQSSKRLNAKSWRRRLAGRLHCPPRRKVGAACEWNALKSIRDTCGHHGIIEGELAHTSK